MLDLMIVVSLLIIINILLVVARMQSKKWVRVFLSLIAFLLLFPALLFGIRAIV